jgi:uncharacterized membrane protein
MKIIKNFKWFTKLVYIMWNDMWNNYYRFHESKKSFQSFLEYICIFEYVVTCIFVMKIYFRPP